MNDLTKFDQLQADLTLFVAPVKEVKVQDKSTQDVATATLREVKRWEKKVEEKRKELVGPLNDQVRRINEYAKTICRPLEVAENLLKIELLTWERILEKEREEARRIEREEALKREAEAQAKIEAQIDEAETLAMFEGAEKAAEIQAQAQAETTRIDFEAKKAHWDASKEIAANKVRGTTKRWTFDLEDLSLVPREYMLLDDKKVRVAIHGGIQEIPGLKIYQEVSISVR